MLAEVEAQSSNGLFAINKANATNLGLPVSILGFQRGRGHSKESLHNPPHHTGPSEKRSETVDFFFGCFVSFFFVFF